MYIIVMIIIIIKIPNLGLIIIVHIYLVPNNFRLIYIYHKYILWYKNWDLSDDAWWYDSFKVSRNM
jgi:hypothetical protein